MGSRLGFEEKQALAIGNGDRPKKRSGKQAIRQICQGKRNVLKAKARDAQTRDTSVFELPLAIVCQRLSAAERPKLGGNAGQQEGVRARIEKKCEGFVADLRRNGNAIFDVAKWNGDCMRTGDGVQFHAQALVIDAVIQTPEGGLAENAVAIGQGKQDRLCVRQILGARAQGGSGGGCQG